MFDIKILACLCDIISMQVMGMRYAATLIQLWRPAWARRAGLFLCFILRRHDIYFMLAGIVAAFSGLLEHLHCVRYWAQMLGKGPGICAFAHWHRAEFEMRLSLYHIESIIKV